MKKGNLVRIFHRSDLDRTSTPPFTLGVCMEDYGWNYYEWVHFLRILKSDGGIEYFPVESFHIEVVV
jgi:hypothetical protein